MTATELFSTGLFKKPFTPQQLASLEAIDIAWATMGSTDKRQQAYVYATTFHETGATMLPIKERGSEKYLKSKKYWPWIGRGFVQLTHQSNYKFAGEMLGIDLLTDPNKAMEPTIAAKILVSGMMEGWFTSKKLHDYINETRCDYIQARRIINILDKAELIAGYAQKFEKALST